TSRHCSDSCFSAISSGRFSGFGSAAISSSRPVPIRRYGSSPWDWELSQRWPIGRSTIEPSVAGRWRCRRHDAASHTLVELAAVGVASYRLHTGYGRLGLRGSMGPLDFGLVDLRLGEQKRARHLSVDE